MFTLFGLLPVVFYSSIVKTWNVFIKIEKIYKGEYSWAEIFGQFVLHGRPFLLSGMDWTSAWTSRTEWVLPNGHPNLEVLCKKYG